MLVRESVKYPLGCLELTGVNLTHTIGFSNISLSGAIPQPAENDSHLEINWS